MGDLLKRLFGAKTTDGNGKATLDKDAAIDAYRTEVAALRTQLKEFDPPSPPEILGRITLVDILNLYTRIFPGETQKIFISDEEFPLTTIAEVRRFVEWDKTDQLRYSEDLDCDEFAVALAGSFARSPGWSGLPTGFIWGSLYNGHAFETVVAYPSREDLTPTIYFIEPQDDHELANEMVEEMFLWLVVI